MPVRPTLLHRMALVSFLLFRKNLGNLREFFGQIVYRHPPGKKLPVRLCLKGNVFLSYEMKVIRSCKRRFRVSFGVSIS